MIAPAPGVGFIKEHVWWRMLSAFLGSALVAGGAVGLLLAVAAPVSLPVVVAPIIVGATAVAALVGVPRPRLAAWRVPRRAYFAGRQEGVGAVFGGALGSMFLTELPSYGAIALAAWAVLVAQPAAAVAAFACFGLARALPVVSEGLISYRWQRPPPMYSSWYSLSRYLALPEAVLLGTLALRLWP